MSQLFVEPTLWASSNVTAEANTHDSLRGTPPSAGLILLLSPDKANPKQDAALHLLRR
jgi:hypothetical protein